MPQNKCTGPLSRHFQQANVPAFDTEPGDVRPEYKTQGERASRSGLVLAPFKTIFEKGEVWLTQTIKRKSFNSAGWKEFPIRRWKCILACMRVMLKTPTY